MNVLGIGDSAALNTGFGRTMREILTALERAGHTVYQVASLDAAPFCRSEPFADMHITPFFTHGLDPVGFTILPVAIRTARPECIVINCDPGTAARWVRQIRQEWVGPIILYAPVEGAPITSTFVEAFKSATLPFTCTEWAQRRLLEDGLAVPFVHHGVDPEAFRPLSLSDKFAVRRELGWDGKFVVTFVGRNNGRKGHDKLIEAVHFLKESGVRDLVLYLHCKSFDSHQLQGWNLDELVTWHDVQDVVQFSHQGDSNRGEPEVSLMQKLAASDMFVSASMVEGFGLPLLEAMACGVPVVVPQDNGNQEEVVGSAALAKIRPIEWLTWHTGARLASVHPQHIAEVIRGVMDKPALLEKVGHVSRQRALTFPWQPLADTFVKAVESVAAYEPLKSPGPVAASVTAG